MKLKITNAEEIFDSTTYHLSLSEFGQKEFHPFIASQDWDCVEIDLTEETPRGILKQLIQNVKVIPIFNKKKVSIKVLQLLCEIAPDCSGKLRSTYMKDKVQFYEYIDEMVKKYDW